MVASDQMSFLLKQDRRWTGVEASCRCCSKYSMNPQGTAVLRLHDSWGLNSIFHPNINLSRLVSPIFVCGICSAFHSFEHHLYMIMPGYVSPTHTSLLNPMYVPHSLAPCGLSPWKHPGSLAPSTRQKHLLCDDPLGQ